MKKSAYKILHHLRYPVISSILLIFAALFSGFLLNCDSLFKTADWQFMPGLLGAAALGSTAALSVLLIIAIITACFGRVYCSWFCPLGLLQEVIDRTAGWIFRKRERKYQKPRLIFRAVFFVIIMILLLMGIALPLGYVEPYSLFGKLFSGIIRKLLELINVHTVKLQQNTLQSSEAYTVMLWISSIAMFLLVLLTLLKGRIFCNTVCPAGTILAAIAARSGKRLFIDSSKCVKCRKCEKICNASCINIGEKPVIDFANCFMCMECAGACPVGAIQLVRRQSNDLSQADLPKAEDRRKLLQAAGIAGLASLIAGKTLQKTLTSGKKAILPPGAGSEDDFLARCTGCGLCIANCRGNCLQPATNEYGLRGFMLPTMKFSGKNPGKCEYECNNCTSHCPTGALRNMQLKEKQLCRIGMARFTASRCLAYADDEQCGACAEHCPTGALKMVAGPHKFASVPKVIADLCIGCGNCQYACPVTPQAIEIKAVAKQTKAADPAIYRQKEEVKKAPSSIPF